MTRAAVAAAALVMGLAPLTSCADSAPGSEEPGGSTSAAAGGNLAYNDADLHFAQSMAPHHDQAIAMSTIILDKSGVNGEVRAIAEAIRASHQPQIDTITTWGWAEERTAHEETEEEEGPGHHGGQDGLMTEDQMMQLDTADAPDAQKLFVTGMIRHHPGRSGHGRSRGQRR